MGEAAKVAGNGGKAPRDGGAGDARALRRGRRAPGPAAQHTAAGRRVRTGRASTVTSPLPASRADEKQLPAAPEQVRERRAGVGGGRGGCGRCGGCGGGGGRAGCGAQEGRAAAEGHALVGAHGRAGSGAGAAVRDGPAARAAAARRVTEPRRAPSLPYHAYIPLPGAECTRVPEYYRLGIYLFGSGGGRAVCTASRPRSSRRL